MGWTGLLYLLSKEKRGEGANVTEDGSGSGALDEVRLANEVRMRDGQAGGRKDEADGECVDLAHEFDRDPGLTLSFSRRMHVFP